SAILSFCAIFMSFRGAQTLRDAQNAVRTCGNNRLATALFRPERRCPRRIGASLDKTLELIEPRQIRKLKSTTSAPRSRAPAKEKAILFVPTVMDRAARRLSGGGSPGAASSPQSPG